LLGEAIGPSFLFDGALISLSSRVETNLLCICDVFQCAFENFMKFLILK
jgi:hypothetical protein